MLWSTKFSWVVLVSLIVAGQASALEDVAVDVSIDYAGKYIWRGQALTDDPVVQPSVTLSKDKLSLNIWGSMDTTNWNSSNYKDSGEFREIDYTLDYTDALPGVDGATYSAGFIYYSFPTVSNTADATSELYAGVGFDCVLSPTATLYYDVDEVGGFYASFGISHSLDISELGLSEDMINSLDLSATLGYADRKYNNDYWSNSVDAINDLVISATIPVKLCSNATLNASCNYVSLLDSSIKRNATSQKSDYVYGSIGVAMSF